MYAEYSRFIPQYHAVKIIGISLYLVEGRIIFCTDAGSPK